MFEINITHPDTFWLNITNIGLGLITLLLFLGVAYGIVREGLVRLTMRTIDRELRKVARVSGL